MRTDKPKWIRWKECQAKTALLPKAATTRSAYKIIMKWAKKYGVTYRSCGGASYGYSKLYLRNKWIATIGYHDRGRHVIGSVEVFCKLSVPSDDCGRIKTPKVKDALRLLNEALRIAKNPDLELKDPPPRILERRKFTPTRKSEELK